MHAADWKAGLSSSAVGSLEREVFEAYAQNGLQVMEISLPWEMYASIPWKDVQRLSAETGVEVRSIHLPFLPFAENDLSSLDAQVRQNTVQGHTELMALASEIGTRIAVVHPSAEPIPAGERADRLQYTRESLAKLAENAEKYGVTVAVENLPRTCIGNCTAEMRFLLTADERLRLCFDTNHLLGEKNADYIRALGQYFINIHVSDYDFVDERHWLPYEGKTDWVELVTLLEDAGYEGPFLYEVPRHIPSGLNRRNLTYADYRANYEACVNKRPAPRII